MPDEPEPLRGDVAHGSRVVQLGGDRRGRRRALRHPDRAGRPLRPQHLAGAARAARRSCSRRAGSRPACPSTRPATTGASSRPPPPATAWAPTRSCPGAGADEILDMCVKAFLPAGRTAVVPVPSYAMYRVVTRAARRRRDPGPSPRAASGGFGDGRPRRFAPPPATPRSSGCATRTTRPGSRSPRAPSRRCSTASRRTPPPTDASPPPSSWTRPTPSSRARR